MTRRRTSPGFTLIELLVALAISSLVVTAAVALVQGQQNAYRASTSMRDRQEAGRMALEEITRTLRNAGYGVDPALAFDFGPIAEMPRSALFGYAKGAMTSYRCDRGGPVRCRDRTDLGDGSDELVFLARDPEFSRPVSAADTFSVQIVGDLRQPLYEGQVLQVMCLLDHRTRAYVTVGQRVDPVSPPDPTRVVFVNLKPGRIEGGLPAFPYENEALADSCFGRGGAVVTRVNRFRYFVEWYAANGDVVAAQTAGARPYLMFDPGTIGPDNQPMVIPLTADVEDLQLTYLYPPAAAGDGSRLVGATAGVNAADEAFPIRVDVRPPAAGDAPGAASRVTGSPANIQGVRVSLVVRSSEVNIALAEFPWSLLPAAGNRAEVQGLLGYRRMLFESTVITRNLQSRAFVYTVVDPAGQPGMNLGGG